MRIVLYSGKGGVGKTSLSAASAVRAAQLGHRTLVVSTDAAHSLADALDVPVGGVPTPVARNLDALEIDVNLELESHWGVIHDWLTRFMTAKGVADAVAEEIAILPGLEELFSLLKVRRYAPDYDFVVVDCAPTGETVRMLAVPEVLSFYFTRIFPLQRSIVRTVRPLAQHMTDLPLPPDDVFGAVKSLYEQMQDLGPLLQDPKLTSIRLVLNPERMVVKESERLYTYLNLFGFAVDAVVANRVLPAEAGGGYFDRWMEIQARHLAHARKTFEPLPFLEARLFDREMVGLPRLSEFAREVFASLDPAAVMHEERPVEVKREGRYYALYVRLPFADKESIDVHASGEDLVIQVDNQRRTLLLPRTLAGRRVTSATFRDRRLRVAFGERMRHARA